MRFALLLTAFAALAAAQSGRFTSADLYKLRSVGDVAFSPAGTHIAYTVSNNGATGRPYSQIHVLELSTGRDVRLGQDKDPSSQPEWSPDGRWIAWSGKLGGKTGLLLSRPDGSEARYLAEFDWTNHPMPETGKRIAWAPDSKRLAFVASVPGPESEASPTADPVVITRYLYKPDHEEGHSHFNDNRRTHIFLADAASGRVTPLTTGGYYEHSIDWSPNGAEILFVSNRETRQDLFFNYDLFTVRPDGGAIRRLTATESAEYVPRWSPDGSQIAYLATRRGLTDLETTMEDTHVWLMNADGTGRRDAAASLDARQLRPSWSPGGEWIYFTAAERGSVRLARVPRGGGDPIRVVSEPGTVSAYSLARDGRIAYAFSTPSDLSQLYLMEGNNTRPVTALNAEPLRGKTVAPVESFTFVSNDNRWEVEAFLTRPAGQTADSKHPLIVVIHGGPHGQQGPAFNFKNQVYASRGWATLMVNYRGSTGYGQKFADGVFGDQNGNEGQDVLYGLSAALRRNLWIDRDRLGVEGTSYGGQLSAWLVTQTRVFKAAIPQAAITNLVSYNYMTYYNMYEQMTFGILPHQGRLMDELWERSALKHVAKVATPTLLLHGENDADVPIAEAEQFYIALKDVGVETVMVRYPREGHGLREPRHIVDSIDRSIAWYEKYFPKAN